MNEKDDGVSLGVAIMTVHDVAEYLRLSEAKIYKMAREGHVPAIRMGKKWRFKKDLIDDWIRRETELAFKYSEQTRST